ncbi:MAG: hypothetical protein GY754_31590 [bacterium]|nr:hypothetical protein [bacterium]
MKKEYKDKILEFFSHEKIVNNAVVKKVPAGTILLSEGDIASYLGITPVSLSRIRTRIKKQINNC